MALRRVKATFDYLATEPGELSIKKGDIIVVLEVRLCDTGSAADKCVRCGADRTYHFSPRAVQEDSTGWWKGDLKGLVGFFPSNFSEPYEEQPTDAGWALRRVRCLVTMCLPAR